MRNLGANSFFDHHQTVTLAGLVVAADNINSVDLTWYCGRRYIDTLWMFLQVTLCNRLQSSYKFGITLLQTLLQILIARHSLQWKLSISSFFSGSSSLTTNCSFLSVFYRNRLEKHFRQPWGSWSSLLAKFLKKLEFFFFLVEFQVEFLVEFLCVQFLMESLVEYLLDTIY